MVNLRSHTTRLGVLDIGSNTIHMLIVDAAPGARPDPEASTKSTVRLMKYLKDDGSIKKSGIEAILEAVSQCMRLAEEYEITQLLVMATSALREAPNGNKVIHKIEELIGQGVTVLSGTDEARLTFLAARRWYGWDAGRLLVLDIIGGGSLRSGDGLRRRADRSAFRPAGAGRVTTEFLPSAWPHTTSWKTCVRTCARFWSRWSRFSRNPSTRIMQLAPPRPSARWLACAVR